MAPIIPTPGSPLPVAITHSKLFSGELLISEVKLSSPVTLVEGDTITVKHELVVGQPPTAEPIDPPTDPFRCAGSNQGVKAINISTDEERTQVIGQCFECRQQIAVYKDLGYWRAVEHLPKPNENACGECGGSIWDEDYLCALCRMGMM